MKYCSDRCRSRRIGPLDRKIESIIVALLDDIDPSGIEKTAARSRVVKGDPRLIVTCDEIEEIVYGSRFDPLKTPGRLKNRKARGLPEKDEGSVDADTANGTSVDLDDTFDEDEHTAESVRDGGSAAPSHGRFHVRPPQTQDEINFSAGGGERSRRERIEETTEHTEKRKAGDKQAAERETIRRAARRLVVFGVEQASREEELRDRPSKRPAKSKRDENADPYGQAPVMVTRKAEAFVNGVIIEPSFAKGNWSVRWRERNPS